MVPERFKGKVALIAGGASGIGQAIATRLHAEGASVVVGDLNAEGLDALAALGDRVATLAGNVTVEADAEALVALAVTRFRGLDAAFNVAGASRPGYIVDLAEDEWDFTVDLCLKGVFLGMKHQARQMIRQGRPGGAIVNIASLNAHVPMHAGSAYVSAKAGVEALSKNGALEFAPYGIRVNAILPGPVDGPRIRAVIKAKAEAEGISENEMTDRTVGVTSLKCFVTQQDIANMALYLASPFGRTISGQAMCVDADMQTTM